MLLEISAGEKTCQHKLVHNGNRAGVKIQFLAIAFQQTQGKNHETHAHGRGDGLGEGVHVDHAAAGIDALECGNGAAGEPELAVIVIFDDETVGLLGPAQKGLTSADGGHDAGGIMMGGGDVCHGCTGGGQSIRIHAVPVHGNRNTGGAVLFVDLSDFGISRILNGKHRAGSKQLCQKQIKIFCAGAYHDLFRQNGHAAGVPQVFRNGLPQRQKALMGCRREEIVFGQHLTGETGPCGGGEQGEIRLIAAQIQLPTGNRRFRRECGLRGGHGGCFHRTDEESPFWLGIDITLCLQLLIGGLHRDDGNVQMFGQCPLGGELFPGRQGSV